MNRVNPDLSRTILDAIERSKRHEERALEQLTSGRRINSLSDDPAGAAAAMQNRIRLGETDQFLRNASSLGSLMRTAEAAMNEVMASLTRTITLGVQGATDTLSSSDRSIIATEVRGLSQRLLSLANTSVHGQYVFAGTAVTTPPFAPDSGSPSGVRYDGNTAFNTVQIAPGQTLEVQIPGDEIFTFPGADAFQALNDLAAALESGTGEDIAAATGAVRAAFDHINVQRTRFGNTLGTLERAELFLQREKVELSQRQDDLVAADLAASITDMLRANDAREAVLASAGKISGLNLFDFI